VIFSTVINVDKIKWMSNKVMATLVIWVNVAVIKLNVKRKNCNDKSVLISIINVCAVIIATIIVLRRNNCLL
jgi:uncharacterized membrane protein SirB2